MATGMADQYRLRVSCVACQDEASSHSNAACSQMAIIRSSTGSTRNHLPSRTSLQFRYRRASLLAGDTYCKTAFYR